MTPLGRILGVDQVAPWDMPQWDNSAMDGYAVRAADCADPKGLPIAGFLPAGQPAVEELGPGTAIRIMTGAPLPAGADAVVPFEDAEERAGILVATRRPVAGDHVRKKGGDIREGETVLTAGTTIGPVEVSLLASISRASVPVIRRARVAILSTGDELLEPGEPLAAGKSFSSNAAALAAATLRAGARPLVLPIARDDREALRTQLVEGLLADVLVTTAGVPSETVTSCARSSATSRCRRSSGRSTSSRAVRWHSRCPELCRSSRCPGIPSPRC